MPATLEPIVTFRQELLVTSIASTMQSMDEKAAFAQRLNELCDDMGIPPKGENRQTTVGKQFGVTQKGARKWLEGEGFPKHEQMIAIARWAGVNYDWLTTGRGQKKNTALRPKLEALVRAAQPLNDYEVDQLIKIVPVIAKPDPGAGDLPNGDEGITPSKKRRR